MDDEIVLLLRLYKESQHYKERERYHAVLLVKEGKSIAEVAKLFHVTTDAVRHWLQMWEGKKQVLDRERSGRPPKLTPKEEEELCNLVDKNNPQDVGYNVAVWDCTELQKYVQERFEKSISKESLRQMLLFHRFSYRKIAYLFTKRDAQQREQFVQEVFTLYDTKSPETVILFGDEMSTKLHPKPGYVWTRNGTPLVRTACSHKKLHTLAAVEPLLGGMVHATYDKNNAYSFVAFLQQIEKKYDQEVILILDNYPVHHSRVVRDYLAKVGKIKLKFLPTYSPDLNPIEWLWGYTRKKYLNCRTPTTIDQLRNLLECSLDALSAQRVRSVCTLQVLTKCRVI